ncbi:hypothetical protein LNQ03_32385 [Klebsiella pneumoniae subsp. pneumoniae]|nr:hypothetical protein [Klebsiella pneumoniae subsp. pneumoniae]
MANDGTPFADEVTLNWINQKSVLDDMRPSGRMSQYRLAAALMQMTFWPLNLKRSRKADTDGLDAAPLDSDAPGH